MTKEEKNQLVAELTESISASPLFYLTDSSELDAATTSSLRRECHKNDIQLRVVKNTLLKRAFEAIEDVDYSPLYDTLKGNTAIMFAEVANAPAKLIKSFRKTQEKPLLKGAFIEQECYIGDDQVEMLSTIKSKEELIGDIIGLLQSPAKNVISSLQSGSHKLSGLVKTLSER
jgi:large subunit ribosomal protein L10